MPNSGVSGKYGLIRLASGVNLTADPPTITSSANVVECTGWTFDRKSNVHQYASNLSEGYKRAVAGTKMASGSCKGMYDPTDAIWGDIKEGDSVTLMLYTDPDNYFLVPAVVESLKFNVDFDNGDIVSWDISYVSNGKWFERNDSTSTTQWT